MLDNNPESSKLTIQRLASTLKGLEKKYNEIKADRTSLLQFVEEIIPEAKLEAKVGQIDCEKLIRSYNLMNVSKQKIENELKLTKDKLKNLEEDNANLKATAHSLKLKIEDSHKKIFKLETELKSRVNLEGDVLLSKIKSIGSPNQPPSLNKSLEENKEQAKLIASLKSELASIQSTLKTTHTLEKKENEVQTDDKYFDKEDTEGLKQLLEKLQHEYSVI